MTTEPSEHEAWFRNQVAQYEGPLVRYTARIVGNLELAREVVQEAFLKLHEQAAGVKRVEEVKKVKKVKRVQAEQVEPFPDTSLTFFTSYTPTIPASPQAWLYTVCRRRAIDVRRKEGRMKVQENGHAAVCELPGAPPGCAGPSEVMEQAETHSAVTRLLAQLPENQQEVVRLKFQDGLSYRDIAAVTGLTVTNVGYLLHIAVKKLREQLAPGH